MKWIYSQIQQVAQEKKIKQAVWHIDVRDRNVYRLCAHAVVLNVLGNIVVDGGWQGQVEEPVSPRASWKRLNVCVEFGERIPIYVFPTDVRVPAEEGRQPVYFCVCHLCQRGKTFNDVWTTHC